MTNDDRTPSVRIRVTGLQEAQLPDLVKLDALCAAIHHDAGIDAAEVPSRDLAAFMALGRQNSCKVAEGARAVLTVLRVRGISVMDAARERILAQKDPERLERWLEKPSLPLRSPRCSTARADLLSSRAQRALRPRSGRAPRR